MRSFILFSAFALPVFLPACRRLTDDGDDTLTVLYEADERLFGPVCNCDSWFLVFLPLVTSDGTGGVAPRLAQSWERSPDSRHWTFYLRSDVRWHDGVPTTAHDVKYTIEFQGRPDILFEDAWHDVDSILVHNDTTLSIHYSRPKDALNDWVVYWPKHIIEDLDPGKFREWEFWTRPVGNGPYRYVSHLPKTMVALSANPDFYAGKPAIEHLRIKFGGSAVAVTELLSGNVDAVVRVDRAAVLALADDPRFRLRHSLRSWVPWLNVLAWNHRHPIFADARIRRALTLGLDRKGLLEFLGLPEGSCLSDVLFTIEQCRNGQVQRPIAFDPDRARRLLADAGWAEAAGDSILQRHGEPLSFTVLVSSDEEEAVSVFSQAAFRRIGVNMEVQRLDRRARVPRIMAGDFEAAILPFWNVLAGHIQWFGLPDQAPRLGGFPDIGYRNPEVLRLLAEANATVDPDEQSKLYRELAPLFLADMPVAFLYPQIDAHIVHRRLRGLEPETGTNLMTSIEKLWIEG